MFESGVDEDEAQTGLTNFTGFEFEKVVLDQEIHITGGKIRLRVIVDEPRPVLATIYITSNDSDGQTDLLKSLLDDPENNDLIRKMHQLWARVRETILLILPALTERIPMIAGITGLVVLFSLIMVISSRCKVRNKYLAFLFYNPELSKCLYLNN